MNLSDEQRQICRVFYLARIDINAFVPLIIQGGYDLWLQIARQTKSSWTILQARCIRWNPAIMISLPSVDRLTALSLWVHCRIILGTETNIDSLDLAAVEDLVLSEVCSYETTSDLEMPKLEHSNGFDVWY